MHGVLEITGVIMVDVNGNAFVVNINSTVPIDNIASQIRTQIANFLGGGYTTDDISLDFSNDTGTKRGAAGLSEVISGQLVSITVGGSASSAPACVTDFALLFAFMFLVRFF